MQRKTIDLSKNRLFWKTQNSLESVTSFPVKATSERNVEESDNTLKTHVETAETDFNEVETKTVRLLEWLLDQSEIKS